MTKVVWLPNETDCSYSEFVAPNTPHCLRSSQGDMFADDTMCYAQGTTTDKVQNYLQFDVMLVLKWYRHLSQYRENGCMLLETRQMIHNNSQMEIILDGKLPQMYECTAYLGVELTHTISWSPYILKLCGKLPQR